MDQIKTFAFDEDDSLQKIDTAINEFLSSGEVSSLIDIKMDERYIRNMGGGSMKRIYTVFYHAKEKSNVVCVHVQPGENPTDALMRYNNDVNGYQE